MTEGIIYLALMVLNGILARRKGRSVVLWVVFAFVGSFIGVAVTGWTVAFPIIIAVILAALPATENMAGSKKCPFCAETVKAEAVVCKHCKKDLQGATSEPRS